jgi:hypothetical protein
MMRPTNAAALLPLLSFLATATAAPSPPSCGQPGGAGTCYIGFAFRRLRDLDATGCCQACTAAATCASWEIRADQGDTCVLKDNSHTPVRPGGSGNCSHSGTKGGPPPPPPPPTPSPSPTPPTPAPPSTGPRINDMFHGGAVLQRNAHVAVWGLSTARGVTVSVGAGADTVREAAVGPIAAQVNASGVWMVWLPPQPAGYHRTLTAADASGHTTVVVSFGEAVLCVGQSSEFSSSLVLPLSMSHGQRGLKVRLNQTPPRRHGYAGGSFCPWLRCRQRDGGERSERALHRCALVKTPPSLAGALADGMCVYPPPIMSRACTHACLPDCRQDLVARQDIAGVVGGGLRPCPRRPTAGQYHLVPRHHHQHPQLLVRVLAHRKRSIRAARR